MKTLLLILGAWLSDEYTVQNAVEFAAERIVIHERGVEVGTLIHIPEQRLYPPPTCPAHHKSYESYTGGVAFDSALKIGMGR